MRGHGRSDHPQDFESYSSIKFAEDFMIVCSVFGLKKPFICGWYVPASIVDIGHLFIDQHFSISKGAWVVNTMHFIILQTVG